MIVVEKVDPQDEETFRELGDLLVPMVEDQAIVDVVFTDAAEEFWLAIAEGNTFVAWAGEEDDRKLAGVLSIVKGPCFWYNRSRYYFRDFAFYVARDQRFALVGVKLLRAARDQIEPKGVPIFIQVVNPRRRAKGVPETYYSTIAGYLPAGHVTMIRRPGEVGEQAAEV